MSQPSTIDPKVIQCVTEALGKAFSVQLGVPLQVKLAAEQGNENEIAAVLSLLAPNQRGSLAILFPKETFLCIFEKMLGEKPDAISSDNADAAAELLNIVFGLARKPINLLGYEFQPAIPSVIRGEKIQINHQNPSEVTTFGCRSELGAFNVELSLKKVG